MTATQALLAFFGIWIACGVVASIVMGRRGHDPISWLLVGAALGPLVLVGAREAILRERETRPRVVELGTEGTGSVSVLVGLDGSVWSRDALDAVVDLLASRVERLELATVTDYDAETHEFEVSEALLADECERIRTRIGCAPATVVLIGSAAEALVARAREGAFDYLVIGRHGAGASKVVFGNVARKINSTSTVPVITVSGAAVRDASTGVSAGAAGGIGRDAASR
jgi:nucleotide-binding universal stress UspA family protein